jgi:hypothetical protein
MPGQTVLLHSGLRLFPDGDDLIFAESALFQACFSGPVGPSNTGEVHISDGVFPGEQSGLLPLNLTFSRRGVREEREVFRMFGDLSQKWISTDAERSA